MIRTVTKTKKTIDETEARKRAIHDLRKQIVDVYARAAEFNARLRASDSAIKQLNDRIKAIEDTLNSKDFRLGRGTVDYVTDKLPAVVRELSAMKQKVDGLVRDHTATANGADP